MLGIYVHIPFCSQRCVYCDFYFVTTKGERTTFVDALCREIQHYGRLYGHESVETMYFGGGTPSLLSLSDLGRILSALRQHFHLEAAREVTFEMNPEDLDLQYLSGLRELGINRVSIGIQSFFEEDLRFMNRSHSSAEAEAAIPVLRQAGFQNFTVDLIFGLPEQSIGRWMTNLARVMDLGTPHISTYGLTIEEGTPLHKLVRRGLIRPADEEHQAQCLGHTMDTLSAAGYQQYEISSFALPGHRALHNQRYWQHANYLGLGPSAHSFRWDPPQREPAERWSNVRSLRRYMSVLAEETLPVDFRETLTRANLANERLMLGLRTAEGIDLEELKSTFDYDLAAHRHKELAELEALGLIEKGSHVWLTERGKLLCDTVTARLLP